MIKLSVVIPYYNADNWIGRMLESLLRQDMSLDEYEIVVVDDGSKNDLTVLMDYTRRYSNIKYIRQDNMGPGEARNKGIDHASGEYIFFCDSDDFVEENVFGRLYDIAHDRELDMLFFNVPRVTENDVVTNSKRNFTSVDEYSSGQEYFARPIDKFIPMGVWQFIISRYFVNTHHLRFPSDMIMNEDACFLIDAILVAKKTAKVDADVYYYVYNPMSSIHFSGKVLQAEKWTNNILLFISKLNLIISNKELAKSMPCKCQKNLRWLRNNKAYIVLTEGCRYLNYRMFVKVINRLVDMDSYPKPFGRKNFKKRVILNKFVIRLLNVIYGMKRRDVCVSHLLTLLMIVYPLSCGTSGGDEIFSSYLIEQKDKS